MIYKSAKEALRDGSEVLEGKSCVDKASRLKQWCCEFDNNWHVVIVFKGYHKGYGSDGEDVCRYDGLIDVFSYDEFCSLMG